MSVKMDIEDFSREKIQLEPTYGLYLYLYKDVDQSTGAQDKNTLQNVVYTLNCMTRQWDIII